MKELDGAWEPRGYIGPRLEIRGRRLTRLWRGTTVLETTFRTRKDGDGVVLELKDGGLRYPGSAPYAETVLCRWEDGAITLTDSFPITGESRDVLYPTENSRYGAYLPADKELLPMLEGSWVCEDSSLRLCFHSGRMYWGHDTETDSAEIVCLRAVSDERLCVRDRDPGREGVGPFGSVTPEGGVLFCRVFICDAAPAVFLFLKVE